MIIAMFNPKFASFRSYSIHYFNVATSELIFLKTSASFPKIFLLITSEVNEYRFQESALGKTQFFVVIFGVFDALLALNDKNSFKRSLEFTLGQPSWSGKNPIHFLPTKFDLYPITTSQVISLVGFIINFTAQWLLTPEGVIGGILFAQRFYSRRRDFYSRLFLSKNYYTVAHYFALIAYFLSKVCFSQVLLTLVQLGRIYTYCTSHYLSYPKPRKSWWGLFT